MLLEIPDSPKLAIAMEYLKNGYAYDVYVSVINGAMCEGPYSKECMATYYDITGKIEREDIPRQIMLLESVVERWSTFTAQRIPQTLSVERVLVLSGMDKGIAKHMSGHRRTASALKMKLELTMRLEGKIP